MPLRNFRKRGVKPHLCILGIALSVMLIPEPAKLEMSISNFGTNKDEYMENEY